MKKMADQFLKEIIFSKEDVVNIITLSNITPKGRVGDIRIVTSPSLLAKDLNKEIRFLQGWKDFRKIPTKRQLSKTIRSSIRDNDQAARHLSDLAEILDGFAGLFSNDLYKNLSDNISDALDLLENIRTDIFEMNDAIQYSESFLFQPKGIKAETYFIGYTLPCLYEQHTNKKHGHSVDPETKKPSGPMLRFIKNCAEHIGLAVNEKDIVNSLTAVKKALAKAK